ncbi:MAG: hypothetical protein N3A66_04090 [Planctomycetota bacterium]|nr:hypothetical protein [Planctomycetota bacterium]
MTEIDLTAVAARMRPGEITLEGFLGNDSRPLAEIIAEDARAVADLGLTPVAIADRLAFFTDAGRDLYERAVIVQGRYRLRVREDRGFLPCPFGDGHFRKGETEMFDQASGQVFYWTPLSLHLIRCHGFYGGRGSKYRLEPIIFAAVAELSPSSPSGEGLAKAR